MLKLRLKRVLLILFLLIIKDLILIIILLNSTFLQSYLAKSCINYFSNTYNIDLSIGDVYLELPNKIVLNDIVMLDSCNNELLSAKNLKAEIEDYEFKRNRLIIKDINLEQPSIIAEIDENGVANYDYFLAKFKQDEPVVFDLDIICRALSIKEGKFQFCDKREKNQHSGFAVSDWTISNFDLQVSRFGYVSDTLRARINNFSLHEKSGLAIKSLSCGLKYHDKGISLNNVHFASEHSLLECSELSVIGEDSLYLQQPFDKIAAMNIKIDTAIFCLCDLAPFLPQYKHFDDSIHLHGNISGNIDDLKLKGFRLKSLDSTLLVANLSVNGLPDIEQTIVFGNISKLHTTPSDINRIISISAPELTYNLPASLQNINHISYKGNITGLLSDLVVYGQLTTDFGTIRTDIALIPDFEKMSLEYEGKLQTEDFNLENLVPANNLLGKVSFDLQINGDLDSLSQTRNKISGKVQRFDFKGYSYTNINFDGRLTNTKVDANLDIDDPNLQVEMIGNFDFSNKKQKVSIISKVHADMKALHLVEGETSSSELGFSLICNLSGELSKRPIGEIMLHDANFNIDDKAIKMRRLFLECREDLEKKHKITAKSDYIDLNVYGKYNLDEVIPSVYDMLSKSLPTIFIGKDVKPSPSDNYFNYSFRLKRLGELMKFADPNIKIRGDIYANNGYVFCESNTLYGKINLPEIERNGLVIGKSEIELTSRNDMATIYYQAENFVSSWRTFEAINLNLATSNDSLSVNLNWGSRKSSASGFLQFDTRFVDHLGDSMPRIETTLRPSQFVFESRVWRLDKANLTYDNQEIEVDNFKISNANQSLSIKGRVSKEQERVLSFLIENVDLSNINQFTQNNGYEFGGILSGSGRLANLYELPIFSANINIDNFHINKEDIGRFNLSSKWDNLRKAIVVGGTNKFMEMKATYHTQQDSLDATVMLKNFKLDIFDKYLNKYEFSGVKGEANGTLLVSGSIKKPQLSGVVNLKETEFVYDFMKLKAITEDAVSVSNDGFLFEDFKVHDDAGNIGTLNGGIYHNNFKDFRFDLALNIEDYRVMNTRLSDNNLFYGTVYATGGARIEGTEKDINVYVGARTEAGSKFVMPMEENYQAANLNYLTFVKTEDSQFKPELVEINNKVVKFGVKLDVDVTPDAEVQIVFDQRAGDRIKANSEGKLSIEFNSDEEIYLYGDIEIVKGDYLFTLEDIVNKRFSITPGGRISWSGNPYEGRLDLDAVYSANVSLKELMREDYDTTDQYNMKTNVECHMHLNGELMSPEIQFSINIPNANDKIKTKLASLTQDEINKQLLYVLVLNQFYDQNSEILSQTGTTTNAVGVTTTEMLSNQLSNWLSQISKDIDVGFKYSPGTELSGREIELALSTQVFNERLLINGNVGISDKKYNNENLVGDVEVQWKLNKKGTLRLRGFTRKNTDLESEYGPYTTGAGIFYTEEFDTWKEVGQKIWNAITFKRMREKRKAKKRDE